MSRKALCENHHSMNKSVAICCKQLQLSHVMAQKHAIIVKLTSTQKWLVFVWEAVVCLISTGCMLEVFYPL